VDVSAGGPVWAGLVAAGQDWDWFGQQRGVSVTLECALPGLFILPQLQCVGQGVYWGTAVGGYCG
jgi:hypothetical protein